MQRQRPRLKNGVDVQLQSVFHEGNWAAVTRLADKRFRTFNDPYYDAVRICAESQLDDPALKFTALEAVERHVADGATVKDVDALDLLDWATQDFIDEDQFPETLGVLRVRAAKASPKDQNLVTRCLESCLLRWDLGNAQQIAAILDKSFPQERSFLFWNIAITHMLSQHPQTPPEKRKLYGTLAQRQIERAAAPPDKVNPSTSRRTVETEEEVLLLYDIIQTHDGAEGFKKLVASSEFGPVAQFRKGRKEPLQRALEQYRTSQDWIAIYDMCKACLSEKDDAGQPNLLACDVTIWKQLIEAAGHLRALKPGVTHDIQQLITVLKSATSTRVIYQRNIFLARLFAIFELGNSDDDSMSDSQHHSLQMTELTSFLGNHALNSSCFDDIKDFIEKLDGPGMKQIAYEYLPSLAEESEDILSSAKLRLLCGKVQYFVLSSGRCSIPVPGKQSERSCIVCGESSTCFSCPPCTTRISKAALSTYSSIAKQATDDSSLKNYIMPEYALLIAFCSIRLAFHSTPAQNSLPSSSSVRHLLQALLILEHQSFDTPKHNAMSLVLVQLSLLLGSAHRAREVWDTLGVKRTIMDSLAPVFYDRLSTISPSVISLSDSWGWQLMDLLKSHYSNSLKLRMPRQLIEAFEAGNYNSIMNISSYVQNLRRSCTRVMSLVEEARTERLLGHPLKDYLLDSRFTETSDSTSLKALADYGSFPLWECSTCVPAYVRLGLGPAPSNRRSHLSLLGEAFHDLLGYKAPGPYKASADAVKTDQTFLLEGMSQLHSSISKFLIGSEVDLTPAEKLYFDSLDLLSALLPLCAGGDRSASTSEAPGQIIIAVKVALESLQARIDFQCDDSIEKAVLHFSSLHNVTMLHDTAVAAKAGAQWVLAFNEREKERDRSGKSNLPKDTVGHLKSLLSAAEAALQHGKGQMAALGTEVLKAGFEKRLREWLFDDGELAGGLAGVIEDESIEELVGSWRLNGRGWQHVKWE